METFREKFNLRLFLWRSKKLKYVKNMAENQTRLYAEPSASGICGD